MAWYGRLQSAVFDSLERSGRVRALAVLRGMDRDLVRARGFSPELLDKGLSGWPWRAPHGEATGNMPVSDPIRAAEVELAGYSDSELNELGIARRDIGAVVRNGRIGTDDIAA